MTTTVKKVVGILLTIIGIVGIYLLARYTDVFMVVPEYRELSEEELQYVQHVREQAYDYAVNCSKTTSPALKFEEIHWILNPGDVLRIPTIDGNDVTLKGWFNPKDSTIYIPFTERETFWITAHESMHAIGYSGHPYIPFRSCNLMADQNP